MYQSLRKQGYSKDLGLQVLCWNCDCGRDVNGGVCPSDLASGVRLRGEIGEVWVAGKKSGLLFRWKLIGWSEEWRLEAERYSLVPTAFRIGQRQVELQLDMRVGTLKTDGIIWTEYIADNHSHRAIVIKGKRLKWQRQGPVVLPNNT